MMLRAGFARVDITPPRDVSLMGYEFRQTHLPPGNDGVHDPLYARALVLDDGTQPAAIVALDLCIVSLALARALRKAAAEAVGTNPDRVLVSTVHTHSGPDLEEPKEAYAAGAALPEGGSWTTDTPGQRYARTLPEKVRDAAARAAGLLYPVRAGVRESPLGIGYNRRVPAAEGLRHCWNPQEQSDLEPAIAPDPTCTVLTLEQEGGPRRYVLWSVGAHAVVLGKTSRIVSADWPGAACGAVEELLPGARAVFLPGASGNVHPWIATQEDAAGAAAVGRAAGAFVALLAQAARGSALAKPAGVGPKPGSDERLRIATRTVTIGKAELDLAAWRIGPCCLAAAPVELFSELGLDLRRRVGGPLIIATTTNGWTGYWPTPEAFAEGGYEVDGAKKKGRAPADGPRLIDELASLAQTLD